MTMNWITLTGSVAALCSMVSFVPQAWRIVKSRDTGSISPVMYSFTVTGFALWKPLRDRARAVAFDRGQQGLPSVCILYRADDAPAAGEKGRDG